MAKKVKKAAPPPKKKKAAPPPPAVTPKSIPIAAGTPKTREIPPCQCFQDDDDNQWYCYILEGGRYVQLNGIPFDNQDDCENNCCKDG